MSLIALWIARKDNFVECCLMRSVWSGVGLGVKRLKNVVSDLETKCEGLSFDGHELNE